MFADLLKVNQLFCLAALEWPENTKWIPEDFKKKEIFQQAPPKIVKVFERFGLNDFRTEVDIEVDNSKNSEFTEALIKVIFYHLNQALESNYLFDHDRMLFGLINQFTNIFYENLINAQFKLSNDIIAIDINEDQTEKLHKKNKKIQKGTSIFKIYNFFLKELKKYNIEIPPLETMKEFKEYSESQKYKKKNYLVFSTQITDIAGMASRGVTSCQNLFKEHEWDFSNKLSGSILSKYLGICYLTNGNDYKNRGEKILYRALVRFVINFTTRTPAIMLDKMYPTENQEIKNLMLSEIGKRAKIPVIMASDYLNNPRLRGENKLDFFQPKERTIPKEVKSYQDYQYGIDPQDYNVDKILNERKYFQLNEILWNYFDILTPEQIVRISKNQNNDIREKLLIAIKKNKRFDLLNLFEHDRSNDIKDKVQLIKDENGIQ